MTLTLAHPTQPMSADDCVRAAQTEEVDTAEAMALTAARQLIRDGSHAQAAMLLCVVERALPSHEAVVELRDLLAEVLERAGDLRSALLQAGLVDGQQGTAASALRVGRLKLALGQRDAARHDLARARDWAHMTGDYEVGHTARALLSAPVGEPESAKEPSRDQCAESP